MERKTREVGGDANLVSLNFCVLLALSSQLSVFSKLCIMNTLVHFCYVSHAAVSGTYPYRPRGLVKKSYHGWLSM